MPFTLFGVNPLLYINHPGAIFHSICDIRRLHRLRSDGGNKCELIRSVSMAGNEVGAVTYLTYFDVIDSKLSVGMSLLGIKDLLDRYSAKRIAARTLFCIQRGT